MSEGVDLNARQQRATETLDRYGILAGEPMEDYATQTVDLLADLMHLHGSQGMDDAMRLALMHYEAECEAE